MPVNRLTPYLNFDGKASAAIALYQKALGATANGPIMRYGEVPGMDVPPAQKDSVMHAELQIGGGVLMLSDTRPGEGATPNSAVSVALHLTDVNDATRMFDALAAGGGKVLQPLIDTFWGAKFGIVVDAFGINWMFNCELPKA
jgi:PhnB protein